MGRYSTFIEQKIEVKDLEGLKEELKEKNIEPFFQSILWNDGTINFIEWDDSKVYGYLDCEFRYFLNLISKFIEGWVIFEYEEGFKFMLTFENKKVYLLIEPEFKDWDKIPKEELI